MKAYIKQTNHFSRFFLFLFLFLNIKKAIITKESESFSIFTVPFYENERYFKKLVKYLKKCGIKTVCHGKISEGLKRALFDNFITFDGESVFYDNFNKILSFFAHKKGINLEKNEVCFITDSPKRANKFILKCEKYVKSFSVLTDNEKIFDGLINDLSENKGIYLKTNNKKNANTIYINLDKEKKAQENNFVKNNTIDIFKTYKNTYNYVKFSYKTKEDSIIMEEKIEKDIVFTEFLLSDENNKTAIKIVNIKK